MSSLFPHDLIFPRSPLLTLLKAVASEEHGDAYYWRFHIKITNENDYIIAKTDSLNPIIARDYLG